jgi:hypothetical protein
LRELVDADRAGVLVEAEPVVAGRVRLAELAHRVLAGAVAPEAPRPLAGEEGPLAEAATHEAPLYEADRTPTPGCRA